MNKAITLTICLFTFFASMQAAETTTKEARLAELEQRIKQVENNNRPQNRMRVTGYIQSQFSWGQKDANLRVGAPNEKPEKSFSRIGIREGHISAIFQDGIVRTNLQVDITERGVSMRNLFLQLNDPVWGTNFFRTGLVMIPFGHDVGCSSATRMTPERSMVVQDLFPGERDLGAMFGLQTAPDSPLSIFRLEGGLFAGNRRNVDVDSRMSFIGRLSANKEMGVVRLSGGISYYIGGVFQGTENVYTMVGNGFALNSDARNIDRYAKREYFGADVQLHFSTRFGQTIVRSESIFGQQPGSKLSSRSPNANQAPQHDTFIRPISGAYLIVAQDLGRLPLSAVFKYDWYNPNIAVSGDYIGLNNTGITDLARTAYGFGLIWNIIPNTVRLKAYYEIARMEASQNINHNFQGDSFTLRLQYRF